MQSTDLILKIMELEEAIDLRISEGKRIILLSTSDNDLRLNRLVQEAQALKNKIEVLLRCSERIN